VRQNLAYSERLQGKWTADRTSATALAVAAPAPPALSPALPVLISAPTPSPSLAAQTAHVAPVLLGGVTTVRPAFTIASAPAPSVVAVAANGALLTGRPLEIVDASGAAGGAEAVRQQLVSRGWSAPRASIRIATVESQTRIVFPAGSLAVAEALARTLPFPVQLAACEQHCGGLSLILGQDTAARQKARS
jgi:hypothetical protein